MLSSKKTFFVGAISTLLAVQFDYSASQLPHFLTARAGIVLGYNPPNNRPALQRTEGAGSRGRRECGTYLQLFAPSDRVAVSVSERPTFLAYVSRTDLPLSFVLVEEGAEYPIYERELRVSSPGVVSFSLPPSIKLKKRLYQWTVSAVCNRKQPSKNVYAQAKFERVAASEQLQNQLKGKNALQQAAIYADSGVWYEAIAKAYEASTAKESDRSGQAGYLDLLNSIGLQKITNLLANANSR